MKRSLLVREEPVVVAYQKYLETAGMISTSRYLSDARKVVGSLRNSGLLASEGLTPTFIDMQRLYSARGGLSAIVGPKRISTLSKLESFLSKGEPVAHQLYDRMIKSVDTGVSYLKSREWKENLSRRILISVAYGKLVTFNVQHASCEEDMKADAVCNALARCVSCGSMLGERGLVRQRRSASLRSGHRSDYLVCACGDSEGTGRCQRTWQSTEGKVRILESLHDLGVKLPDAILQEMWSA